MGFSLDGLTGLSPIGQAREAIGAGLAMDHFLNVFWKNSGVPPLVLTSEQELSTAARKRIRRDWDRVQRGFRNAWRTAILEQGVKPTPLSLPLKDAEFIATATRTCRRSAAGSASGRR
jgi:HK97 family phage portal protein